MKHQKMVGQKVKTYTFLSILGEGAWAVVYQAIDQKDGSQIAIKAIPKILIKQTPKLEQLVKTQINVLRSCKNQNVIKFIDTFMSDRSIFIAMQYCNSGDLEHYLNSKKRLPQDQATIFLKQIINGFKGLHEVNAMHRDFKVANVLLHKGVCKIADLGFAKQMEKQSMTKTILGTSLTMAPQVLDEKPYGIQADIWSLGVVYYQLIYGKYPYYGMNDFDILKKIKQNKPDFTGVNISTNAKDFINKCLTINPSQRISWAQIYDHPLIKSQEKIVYNNNGISKMKLNDNKTFYDKNKVDVNKEYMYLDKKKQINPFLEPVFQQQFQVRQSVNVANMIVANEEKKKINKAIEEYEKKYLNRRNNIMFIFKFVTPNFYTLYNIPANHGIAMFITSKKAYHDMKQFYKYLVNKNNFFNLEEKYFKEFIKSSNYQQIISLAKQDVDIISAQIYAFKEDIQNCNAQIKKQFDIQKIYSQNWKRLVEETIDSYEFQLGQALDKFQGEKKQKLIEVIEALIYYRQNSQNAQIQNFDKKMEILDYKQAQRSIKKKLQSVLQN